MKVVKVGNNKKGNKTKKINMYAHRMSIKTLSLNNLKIAGSLIKWGFPLFVLAKCLQFLIMLV